jgi:hypothetical protein
MAKITNTNALIRELQAALTEADKNIGELIDVNASIRCAKEKENLDHQEVMSQRLEEICQLQEQVNQLKLENARLTEENRDLLKTRDAQTQDEGKGIVIYGSNCFIHSSVAAIPSNVDAPEPRSRKTNVPLIIGSTRTIRENEIPTITTEQLQVNLRSISRI